MDNIVGVVGPIARSARDLALFCQAMLEAEAWTAEHQVLEMPWKPEVTEGHTLPARLTIAILEDDGVVRPHPPLIRALKKYRKVSACIRLMKPSIDLHRLSRLPAMK